MSNEEYLETMKKREAIEEDFQCDRKLDVEPFECEDNCRFFYRGGKYEQHSHCLLQELMYWTTYHAASLYENPIPKHCYDDCPCHDGESGYCKADKEHRYSESVEKKET